MQKQFWQQKNMEDFSTEEWESICSNCGKCCLVKLEFDDEPGKIFYTNVICKYFNHADCSCKVYKERTTLVPECLKLNVGNVAKISWMPKSCAYRLLSETNTLPSWHPLLTGKPIDDIHSVKGKCVCQKNVADDDLEDYIIDEDEI